MGDAHLERLLAELGDRAQSEIAQVRADAAARAESIRAAGVAGAAARCAEALAALDADVARRRIGALADARRRARGAVLRAQHALVDRVLAKVRVLAATRLAEPISECGIARRSALLRSYAVRSDVTVDRTASGIRLTADGGHLAIDDTIDAWLDADRAAIAIDVCHAVEKRLS